MKTLLDWLKDVNNKNGYIGVLVVITVIVALALIVSQIGGIAIGDIAAWLSGQVGQ